MAYSFDSISILKDGKRIFPVMGEIHYSRVPRSEWKERLLKMKAGGVTIVSAYVIWIHHEEIEGEYDWSGNRDLRAFMQEVAGCKMKMLLRIGPWSHGEVRNGGFPDWLLKKDFEPRTNDEKYFETVKNWYKKIYEEVSEFICNPEDDSTKENPIIGVQIENEYGHCGGLYEKEGGESHMRRLQKIAKECGFNVSLYTATGWGGAWTGGMLPVMGGYCDAPWDQRTTEIEPSGNYTFTHERNDHNIGSDHGFGYGITFDLEKFPYLTAELGGGLQVTGHRRTIATSRDIAAVALTKLGSGCNLLGFYMYCGGTNPEGKLTTLQESTATGYLNNLPVKSYDFRAPIREFGQVSDTLRELKLLSYFTAEWGEDLCTLPCEIPSEVRPDDLTSLRYAYRSDKKRGYVFVNNYVRHQKMAVHKAVQLQSYDKNTVFPKTDVMDGDFFFFPFNMTYGKTLVKTASVTPLTKAGNDKNKVFVFYSRENDNSAGNFFDFGEKGTEQFLVLSKKDALNSWRMSDGRLIITDSDSYAVENENKEIEITTRSDGEIFVYPDLEKTPSGWKKTGFVNKNSAKDLDEVLFACYEPEKNGGVEVSAYSTEKITEENGSAFYKLDLSGLVENLRSGSSDECKTNLNDIFVSVSYTGDSANLYEVKDGEKKLLLDHFYLGEDFPWEIGLKRFAEGKTDFSNLVLEILPLKKDAKLYLEKWPAFDGQQIAALHSVSCETEKKYTISFVN
ncbi:MAG: beta-galactosidase [Treponema sp.]|nr:beta-galactosidase [Treponema sp.]